MEYLGTPELLVLSETMFHFLEGGGSKVLKHYDYYVYYDNKLIIIYYLIEYKYNEGYRWRINY
jgi:hypothetical protein